MKILASDHILHTGHPDVHDGAAKVSEKLSPLSFSNRKGPYVDG